MAANIERSARLSRVRQADVIRFDQPAQARDRIAQPTPLGTNWLDGQVLDLSAELAAARPRALARLDTEQAPIHDIENGINGIAKRSFDIVVAISALAALAPVFVLIALIVALDSEGPVFFRQFRHGRNRRPFKIYKFRTMKVEEDGGLVLQAKADDGRVTRFGAFLRRSSLDELPQLFNVVLGQMSIVGPRPHAIRHDLVFERQLREYHLRFRSKPGIVGLAQLNGARGEITCRRDIVRRTKLDLLYQRRWSLLLDLRLVLSSPYLLVRDLFTGRSY